MRTFLPDTVGAWKVLEPARLYTGKQIFEYMDGAGEVYLAYHFDTLLVQRYARPNQEEILVEIFDLGDERNAFGISTYMRGRGPAVRIGQDGEYKSGLLCFWRRRYYVCIRIEKEKPGGIAAVMQLGRVIAKALGSDGKRPRILGSLPPGVCRPASLRYFFRDEILRTHFTLPDGNLLQLTDSTECLLARLKDDGSYLLVVRYSDARGAESASRRFRTGYGADFKGGEIVKTDVGRWTAYRQKEKHLVMVFDASTKKRAQATLASVERRLP